MVDDDNVIDVIVSDVPFRSSLSLIHFPREGRDQGSILPTKCACSHSAATYMLVLNLKRCIYLTKLRVSMGKKKFITKLRMG